MQRPNRSQGRMSHTCMNLLIRPWNPFVLLVAKVAAGDRVFIAGIMTDLSSICMLLFLFVQGWKGGPENAVNETAFLE